MADKDRLDLDSDDSGNLQDRLANEVAEAARAAKDQKARDAVRDDVRKKDAMLKYVLIAAGAVVVIVLAVWMNFGREAGTANPVNYRPVPVQRTTVQPQQTPSVPINRAPTYPRQPLANPQPRGGPSAQDSDRDTSNPDDM